MTRIRLASLMLALALSGSAMSASPQAFAQPAVGELISRLKRQGDEAFAGGRYREALQKYDESLSISPDPSLHYSRGRALERLNRFAEAVRAYELFVAEASPELIAQYPDLPTHVASLKPRTALLRVTARPEGAAIFMGATQLGTTPIERPVRLDPGRVEIVATREGFSRESRTVLLTAGEEAQITFALVPLATDRKPLAASREDGSAPNEARPITTRWWFWTGVAIAGAAAATSIVLLTRESNESKGDIAPGRITAPLMRF